MFKEVVETDTHIYFSMCGKFSEGRKAIINSFGLEGVIGF